MNAVHLFIKSFLLLPFLVIFLGPVQSQQTLGLFQNDSLAYNGYSLWTSNRGAYLIDNCGREINSWPFAESPGLSVYLLENGNVLRATQADGEFNAGGVGGLIEEYDWDGNLVWRYSIASDSNHQHHDIEPLPNGNVLAIVWELRSGAEAQSLGARGNADYWPDAIYELEKVGSNGANIVWRWSAWDHLIQDRDSTLPNYGVVADHPERLDINFQAPAGRSGDWTHFNGVDYNEERDEIIISARHWSEVYIIDHSTTTEEAATSEGGNSGKGGDILFRFGNPAAHDNGGLAERFLFGQHDARWIPADFPGEGNITVFNNGVERNEDYSSIDEVQPMLDGNGKYVLGTDGIFEFEAVWRYEASPRESLYSQTQSGATRLPNGNTLICAAQGASFSEVTETGDVVWRYVSPIGRQGPMEQGSRAQPSSAFRVSRYSVDYPGFFGRDLTPGKRLEVNPLTFVCMIYDGGGTTSVINEEESSIQMIYDGLSQSLVLWADKEGVDLTVVGVDGRIIVGRQVAAGHQQIPLQLNPGVYFAHAKTRRGAVGLKIISRN